MYWHVYINKHILIYIIYIFFLFLEFQGHGNSRAVQQLALWALTVEMLGSVSGWVTKIPQVLLRGEKEIEEGREKEKKNHNTAQVFGI